MAIRYIPGVNVLDMLKDAGYTTYRIRQEKISGLGERSLQKMREGALPSWGELNALCRLLNCKPWDLIEYVPEEGNTPSDDTEKAQDGRRPV